MGFEQLQGVDNQSLRRNCHTGITAVHQSTSAIEESMEDPAFDFAL